MISTICERDYKKSFENSSTRFTKLKSSDDCHHLTIRMEVPNEAEADKCETERPWWHLSCVGKKVDWICKYRMTV